jgi:hypothetical protein
VESPESFFQRPRHVLVLDTSKSMLAPMADSSRRKIEVARSAVFKILEEVKSQGAVFGMVVFNSTASVLLPLSPQLPRVEEIVDRLVPSGKSAIWDALALGADLLRTTEGYVKGNLVLVTDGWDNMSQHFHVRDMDARPQPNATTVDLLGYMLPPNSQLKLQVIGIGSGVEKDKGVDTGRMQAFIAGFTRMAMAGSSASSASYVEVMTGEELFSGMVNAFVDIPFEDTPAFDTLSSEDIASHAAGMAHTLKESDRHSLVGYLGSAKSSSTEEAPEDKENGQEFDVVVSSEEGIPSNWKERYGPLGLVAEAYMAKDWAKAESILHGKGTKIHPVTKSYWLARVSYAKGDADGASRYLTEAWIEAFKLPPAEKSKIYRRLALFHAKISGDKDIQNFVEILERALSKARTSSPALTSQLERMFERLLELRNTYAKIREGGAVEHEQLVEEIFGLLQDARLENRDRDPSIETFLSFVEVTLAEMR